MLQSSPLLWANVGLEAVHVTQEATLRSSLVVTLCCCCPMLCPLSTSTKFWQNGTFLAVQWRTETATGSLVECYPHVRAAVEKFREKEGFERRQVFFNTDLTAGASFTYAKVWVKKRSVTSCSRPFCSAFGCSS